LKPVVGQPGYYIVSVSLLALVVGTTARLLVAHKRCLSLIDLKNKDGELRSAQFTICNIHLPLSGL
jgi:hypothetical protein